MSYTQRPDHIEFTIKVLSAMNIDFWEIVSNFLISCLIGYIILVGDANPTIGVAAIAFVHSVQLPRLVRAYHTAKADVEAQNA